MGKLGVTRQVVALLLAFGVTACGDDTELAGWAIPVPDGARVIEHEVVPVQDRSARIKLVADLRLGGDKSDPSQAFYQPGDVDADRNGNIYVLDTGNHRVQVFDDNGEYLRTMGREGQGPAEFERPRSIAVAGDRLMVKNRAEVSVWTLRGELDNDYRLVTSFSAMFGTDGGLVVANHIAERDLAEPPLSISAFLPDGSVLTDYIVLPLAPGRRPAPEFAASRDGYVYVTGVEEYEVLALAPDGSARWALRVVSRRMSAEDVADPRGIEPELLGQRLPALSHVAVDGHGHVYVYLYDPAEGSAVSPVDVYSPEGELLFSGTVDKLRWEKARGDHVYVPLFDLRSEEHQIVRYRLEEPF